MRTQPVSPLSTPLRLGREPGTRKHHPTSSVASKTFHFSSALFKLVIPLQPPPSDNGGGRGGWSRSPKEWAYLHSQSNISSLQPKPAGFYRFQPPPSFSLLRSKSQAGGKQVWCGVVVVWCGCERCVATRVQEPTRVWKRGGVPAERPSWRGGNRPCARGDGM